MTGFAPSFRSSARTRRRGRQAILAALVLAGLAAMPPAAQGHAYARTAANDPDHCAPGRGPAVRVEVEGLKSGEGNLFVRAYPANRRDWLASKRYVVRIDARPRRGSVTVCVPLPAPGDYAIAVQHDANGNRQTDLSADGAGMSNNPPVRRVLGLVPRAPSVDKVRFAAGPGITRMTITMQYP